MKRTLTVAGVFFIVIMLCPFIRAEETVVVCGTGDSQSLLRRLATEFERKNPGIKIEVPESIGSSGGIKATAKGECDIGRVAIHYTGNNRYAPDVQRHDKLWASVHDRGNGTHGVQTGQCRTNN